MPKVKHMHWMKWMWSSLDWLVCSANPLTHSFPSSYGVNHHKGWLSCSRTSQFCSHPTTASNAFEELVFWLWPFLPDHFHIEISLSITMNIFSEFGSSGKKVRYSILKKIQNITIKNKVLRHNILNELNKKKKKNLWRTGMRSMSSSMNPECRLWVFKLMRPKDVHCKLGPVFRGKISTSLLQQELMFVKW